ncbi:MAG: carbonic anhydrase [Acidobacteria bacterium]|nr:carbonic anhydrase [Acidobacteriota bacterium]MBI3423728.1 carbonic anhydrase [Acidobacteriota bacterium]
MEKIVRGIHQFQTTHFSEHQELFAQLSHGQQPETLLITCSDSRIVPDLLTQTQPGELFVIRNAGNIIPPYGAANGGEGATIEFAVGALQVKHIVVMGHSHCGAMKGLLQPDSLTALPLVAAWLKHAEATRRVVLASYEGLSDIELLNAAIKENVLVQVDNLRTYPAIAARLAKGDLTLHAWIYEIESGRILAYDAAHTQYVPVSVAGVQPLATNRLKAEPKPAAFKAAAQ